MRTLVSLHEHRFDSGRSAHLLALIRKADVGTERNRWAKQAQSPPGSICKGIAPISPTECWIASAPLLGDVGELAHTIDAGRTWTVVSVPRQVNAIAFVDPLHGWAAGQRFLSHYRRRSNVNQDNNFGTIYDLSSSTPCMDGPAQWLCELLYDRWRLALERGRSARRLDHELIFFTDLLNGWSVNIDGQIFRSINGGKSWTLKGDGPTGTNLQAIQFLRCARKDG